MNKSDTEKLKEKYFNENLQFLDHEELNIIWPWIESNCLQKQDSDAVEFAEWLDAKRTLYAPFVSIKQLYKVFKSQQVKNK